GLSRCASRSVAEPGGSPSSTSVDADRAIVPQATSLRPWHTLYFLPEPHGHWALRGVPGKVKPSAAGAWASVPDEVRVRVGRASPSTVGAVYCSGALRSGPSSPFAMSVGAAGLAPAGAPAVVGAPAAPAGLAPPAAAPRP